MTDAPATAPARPEVGSEVRVPIFQSATRGTLFPEGMVCASAPDGGIELIFIRQELIATGSTGVVVESDAAGAGVEIRSFQFQPVTQDIGHVRVSVEVALDCAASIFLHAKTFLEVDEEAILGRLRAKSVLAK